MTTCESNIKRLREMVGIQCTNGTWDYDPYLHGMANGMIYSLALMENEEPVYLSAPKRWLSEKEKPWSFKKCQKK